MEWTDDALILSVRKHGETSAIASLLTRERGRHLGLVRGGQSRRRQGLLQPGNLVAAQWRARLAEHLGTLTLEPRHDFAALVMEDAGRLRALTALTAVLEGALAEHESHPAVFADSLFAVGVLAEAPPGEIGTDAWLTAYVRWEFALLRHLGFGLDLESCAATGGRDELVYVSPRSGRAVSAEAGAPYRDRLLPLAPFLRDGAPAPRDRVEIAAGLRLTGHFLERHHYAAHSGQAPAARARLVEWVARMAAREAEA